MCERVESELSYCPLQGLKCIRKPVSAGAWLQVVAEASASQQTAPGGDGDFQRVEHQPALEAACWWSGAGCFLLMCWRSRFQGCCWGGRRMPPGSSPVFLVFGWFLWPLRRTQLQVTLELITAWRSSFDLTHGSIVNALITAPKIHTCVHIHVFFFFLNIREQQVCRDNREAF